MQRKISVNFGNLLLSLSEIMDLASPILVQHQQRTAFIAWEIGKVAGLKNDVLEKIFIAALMHDVGAISVEEKVAIHNFEENDLEFHCIRGEVLTQKVPQFKNVSKIIRYHHKEWQTWDEPIGTPHVLASQIVLLADYIERLIDRNKYILHYNQEIIDKVLPLAGKIVHPHIIDYFMETSKREEFWLDLVSSRLYPHLLRHGPYWNVEIDFDEISEIAEVIRNIIDFRSRFTAAHSSRVAACSEILSRMFGLTEHEVKLMKLAGDFHDIGKLIVPNSILEKPDKLTKEEFAVMRCHTYYTYHVISTIGGIQHIAEWAAYHHEKMDGSGYPFHCKAEEISTCSRILTVADMFVAMAEDRPYREGMKKEEIIKIITDSVSNNKLDKRIVDLLFGNYDEIISYVKEKQSLTDEFYRSKFAVIGKEQA
ncbi:MAG: c-di-GMP phosphodiesterase [Candidatus Schekmanbacteria bacterium RBG_16_38_11]|uniref:C-di-GMP phosphodiesterase n=1 Tax=Candidatus Schekmanbacteria bacterium RBG_16_38_11 TaxID=1817880 RepID=A0A1F7RYX1_9BACT|nr:MAG: c-di-GMP phosphodiesterase [Candidatus Schekmanbacteria bacterium RBG_16_38_11]